MLVVRSIGLFILAAVLEIGGAWLIWQGVREHRGWVWITAGVVSLGLYGFPPAPAGGRGGAAPPPPPPTASTSSAR